MRQFKKENCHSYVRSVKQNGNLETIITGQHAHKYTLTAKYCGKCFMHITLPNRASAYKEEQKGIKAYN